MSQSDKPILLTLKALTDPISLAKRKLEETKKLLGSTKFPEQVIQGLFVLGISQFEVMITEILINYFKWIPSKLDIKEVKFSKDEFLNDDLVNLQIDKSINSLSYKKLNEVMEFFFKVLSIDCSYNKQQINSIIEFKETRNLLLHNNLIVNKLYIEKAGPLKRSENLGAKLEINEQYLCCSLTVLHEYICTIESRIMEKYSGYTKIAALRNLWKYLFTSPLMLFDDYWFIDEKLDSVPGYKICKYEDGLSNSEKMFLGMWRAHFAGRGNYIENFSMRSLDSERKEKMLYFLSISGDIWFY